jgi:hypothetical protein
MHIKHLNRSTGSAKSAADYLTKGTSAEHIQVLKGDPYLTAEVADNLEFKHKYTSGVIAWHIDDKPTPEEIEMVLNDYESMAFAGLEPDQYSFSAVQHTESDGSVHVHTFSARCELQTGKSLNTAPPGSLQAFDSIRDYHNELKNWKSPENPLLAKATQIGASNLPRDKKLAKEQINESLLSQVETGFVKNRGDVIEQLEQSGFEIARETKSSISIKDPSGGQNIRLTGVLYERTFNSVTAHATANTAANERRAETSERRAERFKNNYQQECSKRATYNRKRYQRPIADTPQKAETVRAEGYIPFRIGRGIDAAYSARNLDAEQQLHVDSIPANRESRGKVADVRQNRANIQSNHVSNQNRIESTYDRARTTIEQCIRTSASRLSAAIQRIESAIRTTVRSDKRTSRQHRNKHAKHEQRHYTDSNSKQLQRASGMSNMR